METVVQKSSLKDPIAYLSSVHQRMSEELARLAQYTRRKYGAQLTEAEEVGIRTTLDYLYRMIPLHAGDEAASLFPHILGTGNPDAEGAAGTLANIETDQSDMASRFDAVRVLFQRWIDQRSLAFQDVWELCRLIRELQQTHLRHVRLEETEVFPLAEKVLCSNCRTDIVHEMLERRGLEEPSHH
jgi:iron-sulfur cluster repair protein YtfE (RIC family)